MAVGVALAFSIAACAKPAASPESDSPSGTASSAAPTGSPEPPRIPDDFTWTGRYVVPDLDVEVPFTWNGDGGDFQMVAGGEEHPIHFTNVISDGQLYTYTYKWPDIPPQPCSHVGAFTLDDLNKGFADASFAGRETLHGEVDHDVNHFRSVGVIELPPGIVPDANDEIPLRIPLMAGDIYVDAEDPSKLRQLLHFGLQNLYDPNLDEWILIDETEDAAGKVSLPDECAATSE